MLFWAIAVGVLSHHEATGDVGEAYKDAFVALLLKTRQAIQIRSSDRVRSAAPDNMKVSTILYLMGITSIVAGNPMPQDDDDEPEFPSFSRPALPSFTRPAPSFSRPAVPSFSRPSAPTSRPYPSFSRPSGAPSRPPVPTRSGRPSFTLSVRPTPPIPSSYSRGPRPSSSKRPVPSFSRPPKPTPTDDGDDDDDDDWWKH